MKRKDNRQFQWHTQRIRGKNLKIANEKLKQEILLCSRFCHGNWWWSECWYSIGSCSTLWEGFMRILCCTFPKSSKQHGFGEKSFHCSCRECCSMHTRWSSFQTLLGQNTFLKLIQFAIFNWKAWQVPQGCFPRRGHYMDSYKIFSRGGQKWWNLFFPTRN